MSQRRVVISLQKNGRPKRHVDRSTRGEFPGVVEHPVESLQADRYDWHAESGGHHRRTRLEPPDIAGIASTAFREDQHGVASSHQVADVSERLASTRLPLGER